MFIDEENGIEIRDFDRILKRKKIAVSIIILSTMLILVMKLFMFPSISWIYLILPAGISMIVFTTGILLFWIIMNHCKNF